MRNLSDAECGRLFRALLLYSMGERQSINLQGREIGLFDVYTQDIDDDIAAYERKCATNRANGGQSGPVAPSRPQSPHNNNNNNNNNSNSNNKNNNKGNHESEGRATRFTPPTVEEVSAYAAEKGWKDWQFNAQRFVDFYASKGWKVGKDPMKDWKAAARGWVARQQQPTGFKPEQANPALNFEQREYKPEDFGDDFFIDLDKYGEG